MDKLLGHSSVRDAEAWGSKEFGENQIVSMIVLVVMIFCLALTIFFLVRRSKENVAPVKMVILVEQYVLFVDDLTTQSTESKLDKLAPYFFSLFTYLAIGNAMAIFGFAPLATSLTFVLSITSVTWIGTVLVGIVFQKWNYWKEWINPMDWPGKFSPLLSLSFRMFGNITGGSLIIILIHALFTFIWTKIIGVNYDSPLADLNLISVLITPWLSLYFDIFDSLLQAFVFVILTMSYWSFSAKVEVKKQKQREIMQKMKNMVTKEKQII
ncbi:F0F1 ATP synthase subunit A [[Mycoplasma] gypis]|uniref:F0F1 ATP synthase subunit A n=1 Tax=[Mycoplasma] gypis TaxID=92404 RepID=A0ABZ2RQP8_9BACT|nr:F0F1 ATP synthase subunit A [[Mycoplasma] gypis]MBN0919370.1 F0F1 ATP synthase subunit A [[Mycoplasma] gypis]